MWNTLILNIILSVAIIAIAHNIWEYLKTNYSTQKTKNLAEIHAAKYKTILDDLEQKIPTQKLHITNYSAHEEHQPTITTQSQYISEEEQTWMRAELDSFIQSL